MYLRWWAVVGLVLAAAGAADAANEYWFAPLPAHDGEQNVVFSSHWNASYNARLWSADGLLEEEFDSGVAVPLAGLARPVPGVSATGLRAVAANPMHATLAVSQGTQQGDAMTDIMANGDLGTVYHLFTPLFGADPRDAFAAIVATQDGTTVEVLYAGPADDGSTPSPSAGELRSYLLDAHDVLLLKGADLTGTRVVADDGVAAFTMRDTDVYGDGLRSYLLAQQPPWRATQQAFLGCPVEADGVSNAWTASPRSDTAHIVFEDDPGTTGHPGVPPSGRADHAGQTPVRISADEALYAVHLVGGDDSSGPTWDMEFLVPIDLWRGTGQWVTDFGHAGWDLAALQTVARPEATTMTTTPDLGTTDTAAPGAFTCTHTQEYRTAAVPFHSISLSPSASSSDLTSATWLRDPGSATSGMLATSWARCQWGSGGGVATQALRLDAIPREGHVLLQWVDAANTCSTGSALSIERRDLDAGGPWVVVEPAAPVGDWEASWADLPDDEPLREACGRFQWRVVAEDGRQATSQEVDLAGQCSEEPAPVCPLFGAHAQQWHAVRGVPASWDVPIEEGDVAYTVEVEGQPTFLDVVQVGDVIRSTLAPTSPAGASQGFVLRIVPDSAECAVQESAIEAVLAPAPCPTFATGQTVAFQLAADVPWAHAFGVAVPSGGGIQGVTLDGLPGDSDATWQDGAARVAWTPLPGHVGTHRFTLSLDASNAACGPVALDVEVLVVAPPTPPSGPSTPIATDACPVLASAPALLRVDAGEVVRARFHVYATDASNHWLHAERLPLGATLDSHSGAFEWTPGPRDVGMHEGLSFMLLHDRSACDTRHTFAIDVVGPEPRPEPAPAPAPDIDAKTSAPVALPKQHVQPGHDDRLAQGDLPAQGDAGASLDSDSPTSSPSGRAMSPVVWGMAVAAAVVALAGLAWGRRRRSARPKP